MGQMQFALKYVFSTGHSMLKLIFFAGLIFGCTAGLFGAGNPRNWSEPFRPHRIANNVYYVGTSCLASYLFTSPDGHILINSSLERSVPAIRASVEKLGFKFSDIKI